MRRFHWVDAFANRAFAGNGCMVVHDAGDVPAGACMALVRETSLTECTFLEPSDVADVKVRYFLADREVDFAGHPTIASVLAWRDAAGHDSDTLTLETGAGVINIRMEGDAVVIASARPQFGAVVDPGEVAALYGLTAGDIIATPQIISVGLGHTIAVVRDLAALKRARLDRPALVAFCHAHAWPGVADMPAPFLVTLGGIDHGGTFARLFLEAGQGEEDAFTGSATAEAGAYLWQHGLIETPQFMAEQGHWMGRPGQATVRVVGAPGSIERVEVGGQGHILMRGDVDL